MSYYYPPDLSAGAFRNENIVNSLLNSSIEDIYIDLLTTTPNRYDSFDRNVNKKEKKSGITIHRINVPSHKSGFLSQAYSFLFYAKGVYAFARKKNYDLVFASSSRFMTAFIGAFISKKIKTNLFLDIRDIFLDTLNDLFQGIKARVLCLIFNYVEKYTINRANSVNLVSRGFEGYFSKKYPNKKLFFYSNGIDKIFLNKKFKYPEKDERVMIYAGNIGFGQGLHKIIPALAARICDTWKIVIIGDGSAKKILIKELKINNIKNVKIIDPLEQKLLMDHYNSANVLFLHLNDYNAFKKVLPSKIFEYGATSKPILAGVSGYAKKFIDKEILNSETFDPCNHNLAAQSLKKLEMRLIDRSSFKLKFNRKKISDSLSKEIINQVK